MSKDLNRWAGWTVVLVVLIDWCSKFLIQNRMHLYQQTGQVGDWFNFVHYQNHGIAFGIMNRESVVQTIVFAALAVVAIIWLYRFAQSTTQPNTRFGSALIIGGAVGNLGDRLANGSVTDFVQVAHFPYVFNFADAAVTVGAIVLVVTMMSKQPSEL